MNHNSRNEADDRKTSLFRRISNVMEGEDKEDIIPVCCAILAFCAEDLTEDEKGPLLAGMFRYITNLAGREPH